MYRDGKWVNFETTVWWLEVDPEDETKTIERYERFDTIEERQAYIKERIATGLVYDLLGWTESAYGGEPPPYDPEYEAWLNEVLNGGTTSYEPRDRAG